MARDDKDTDDDNFFVRFKHRVDANISAGVKTVFGPPPSNSPPQSDLDSNPSAGPNTVMNPPAEPRPANPASDSRADFSLARLATMGPYSPYSLRRLRQPIPSDIEPGMDPTLFSFHDAFEDLLAVDRGDELPPIKMRYEQKKLLRFMYPNGEPPYIWLTRLRGQGLLPPAPQFGLQPRLLSPPSPSEVAGLSEIEKLAQAAWARIKDTDNEPEMRKLMSAMFDDVEKHVGEVGKETGEQIEKRCNKPDNEEDLSAAFEARWAQDRDARWNSVMKILNGEEFREMAKDFPLRPIPPPNPTTQPTTKEVVTTEEHVDRFGFHHKTTTTKILDEEGNEIGTSKFVSISSVDEEPRKSEPKLQPESEESRGGEVNQPRKVVSWFWKKD